MPQRRLVAADFPLLEERFIEHIRGLREHDRLAPIVVLVPTNLLRLHLARTLARRDVNHLNVRFVTFVDFVREANAQAGQPVLPPFAGELLIQQACEQLSGAGFYFEDLVDRPGLHRALAATIADLKQAGMSREQFVQTARRAKWGELTRKKVDSFARVWERYEVAKSKAGFIDDDDALALAAAHVGELPLWRGALAFIVYGLYDFNQLQLRLLLACAEGRDTTVYFPHEETPAFAFAATALEQLSVAGFVIERPEKLATNDVGGLAHLKRNLFAESPSHPVTLPPPHPLKVLSVPGETREAREIIRQVLRVAGEGGSRTGMPDLHGRRVGILLHDGAPYSRLLREVCAGVGLTPFVADGVPLAETPAGRSFLLLLRIIESDYSRRAVMEFVTTTDLVPPSRVGEGTGEGWPTALWDALTIRAKIVGGREGWQRGLNGLPSLLADRNRRRDADERRIDPGEVELLRKFIGKLFALLGNVEKASTWTKLVNAALRAASEFIAASEESQRVLGAVEGLRLLDGIGAAPEARLFARLCVDALRGATARCGEFEQNQPTIAGVLRARGVPFDVVIVSGLVEKSFPQSPAQDSILLDAERRHLQHAADELKLAVRVSVKSARAAEEKMLFRLAVGAARERVVLTFPRIEAENGRERLPSSYLLHVMEAVTGERADYERLEAWQPFVERVRLSDLAPKDDATSALDTVEYDLARALNAVEANHANALVAYLKWPHFRNAARCEQLRWTTREYTPFDGRLAGRETLELLRRALRFDAPISASRLEHWAKCPFKFFLKHVLRIDPLDEPETLIKPSPLDQGNMMHDLLATFFQREKDEGRLPAGTDFPQRLREFADAHLDHFARRGGTGLDAVWQLERETILHQLQRFAEKEINWQQTHRPEWFEKKFGDETGPQLALPNGRMVRFIGRMDRIDLSPDGTSAHVTDYKSRTVPDASKPNFYGGEALQAGVYALAVVTSLGKRIEGARYLPLAAEERAKKPLVVEDWAATQRVLAETVSVVVENAERGLFAQHPGKQGDNCKFCDYRRLCMSMQEPLFELKSGDEFASEFAALKAKA